MPRLPSACLTILLLLPSAAQAVPWQGSVERVNGVLQVQNPDPASVPEQEFVLDELWRAGEDEDAEDFFGVIVDAAVAPAGDVFLLDRQLTEVKHYSADGEFLGTLGREGEGPGEFRDPSSLFFLPDGRLAVLQSRPARVVLLELDGTPAGDVVLPGPEEGGFRFVQAADCRSGKLALQGMDFRRGDTGGERSERLMLMPASTGAAPVKILERSSRFDFARPVRKELDGYLHWALMPDDRLVAVQNFDYRLRIWAGDGGLEREVGVDYPDLLRDGAERARVEERLGRGMGSRGRRRNLDVQVEVEPRVPGVRWLDVDGAGRIWVLSGRGAKAADASHLGTFDLFDSEGRLLRRLRLAGEGDLERDRFLLAGDRLLVLREFDSAIRAARGAESEEDEEALGEPEPMSVICYRLPDLDS